MYASCDNCKHWIPELNKVKGFCPVFGKGTILPHGQFCTAWQMEVPLLLDQMRMLLKNLDEQNRVQFFQSMMMGFCQHCGRELEQNPNGFLNYCPCTRDE